MIVAVVGGRDFDNYEMFREYLDSFRRYINIDMIVSGGASGADELAYRYAIERGITFVCHPPNPDEPSPQRYHRRNLKIVEQCEIMIAFPTKNSKGTYHSIKLAEKLRRKVYVISPD